MLSSSTPSPSSLFSVKNAQKTIFDAVLGLNSEDDFGWEGKKEEEIWKVLVFDKRCRDIISPLLKVGDLRKKGVTLHLDLHSARQPVTDVPAIYVVHPSEENVDRIAKDCASKLYDQCYINFAHPTPSSLIERLATKCVESSSVGQISKIFDQHVDYVSLEDSLFTLEIPDSFVKFNSPKDDDEAQGVLEWVAQSLFCVLVGLGILPVIQCPPSGAAHMVAQKLSEKLADHISSTGSSSFSKGGPASSFDRPVLILLDRTLDLLIMAHHTWTYQALVHDLLGMHLNTVKVDVESDAPAHDGETQEVTYDLDSSSDAFLREAAGHPMPKIPVKIKSLIGEYKEALEKVENLKKGGSGDDGGDILKRTKDLEALVSGVPEVTEKKRLIDMHTNIATALFSKIERRSWDNFFSMEEGIITRTMMDKRAVLNLISGENGTVEDKVRLFIIYFLSQKAVSEEDVRAFEEALERAGAESSIVAYLKTHKDYGRLVTTTAAEGSSYQTRYVDSLTSIFKKSYNKVKMLVPQKKEFYTTKVVDAIMELKADAEVERYAYFDPKVFHRRGGSVPRVKKPFTRAIVFVIGGGNYVEYQNLQDYAKSSGGGGATDLSGEKSIIYGTTQLCTGAQFVKQIGETASREGF